jgi:2-phosphoglycolate phosphatase
MSKPFPTPVSGVLFDLDGTLLDTAADFADVVEQLTEQAALPAIAFADIHRTVSNGARALVELTFGTDSTHPLFEERLSTLLSLYSQRIVQTKASLYPGMDRLLRQLESSGIPWGIVTNKPERFSVPLLESLGLAQRCSALICPDHVTHSKPHPEPLLLACQQLGISPKQTVYVGDHPRDIDAGRAADMFTIAVRYGYLPTTPPVEQWQADLIVDHVEEIRLLLPQQHAIL